MCTEGVWTLRSKKSQKGVWLTENKWNNIISTKEEKGVEGIENNVTQE